MRMTFSNAHLVVDRKIGAHHALCTASEVVGGKKVSWVLEKDVEPFLKNSRQKDELDLWSDAFFNDYLIQEIDVLTSH